MLALFPLLKHSGWSDLQTMIRGVGALSKNWTAIIHFAATPPTILTLGLVVQKMWERQSSMADLQQFRTLVTKYRKPWTQGELAQAIDLSANDFSHRLGGTGRTVLTQKNVLDIVVTLAEWQALSWEQAVELLSLMDYPLDTLEWKTRLQKHFSPPDPALPPTQKGTPSTIVPEAPEGSQQLPSGRHRLFQARDLPKGYVPRPKAFDAIKHLLLNHQGNQTTAITTALRGADGFGKTTLALALCHNTEIQAAFPDGILWVELGEQLPRALVKERDSTKSVTARLHHQPQKNTPRSPPATRCSPSG